MSPTVVEQINERIDQADELYHRLVLLVGPADSGKTTALQHVSKEIAVPLINVNLSLSRRMLELTERQRILQMPRLLSEIVGDTERNIALLDNTEILFGVDLKQDPYRLLQGISRSRTIVASWNGRIDGNYVIYAEPNHPEYRRCRTDEVFVVNSEAVA